MRLSDREWMDFSVPYIFEHIQRGKRLKNADHIPGIVPYVSSTAVNNGVDDYIEATEGTRVFENCISLANSGSVGKAFYEPFSYVASDHVTSLKSSKANKYIYLFLVAALEQQGSNFNFNREINDPRIRQMRIMLPSTEDGEPDYEFMEVYIREMMEKKLDQYKSYLDDRLTEIGNGGVLYQSDVEWGKFTIEDLFVVLPGKRLEKRNMNDGMRPFIGSSDSNNGVTGFVSNTNASLDTDVLGVNYNGSVCEAFYHPYECIFSDDVKRLHLKKHSDNKYVLLFFSRCIRQQKIKYEYAYKFNEQRMNRQANMLPITEAGEPNYDYMEQYGRQLMDRKLNQYKSYLKKRLLELGYDGEIE